MRIATRNACESGCARLAQVTQFAFWKFDLAEVIWNACVLDVSSEQPVRGILATMRTSAFSTGTMQTVRQILSAVIAARAQTAPWR